MIFLYYRYITVIVMLRLIYNATNLPIIVFSRFREISDTNFFVEFLFEHILAIKNFKISKPKRKFKPKQDSAQTLNIFLGVLSLLCSNFKYFLWSAKSALLKL